jgi:hypothetical protein
MKNINDFDYIKIVMIFAVTLIIIISMLVIKYILVTSPINVELAVIETTNVIESGVYELYPEIIVLK